MFTTLVDSSNVSIYLYHDEDAANVKITESGVTYGAENTSTYYNSTNCRLVSNTTPPEDWIGSKYVYDSSNNTYIPNPNFVTT
jgi:hypothetical protein